MVYNPLKHPVKNGENGGRNGENFLFSRAELNSFDRALFSFVVGQNHL